MQKTVITIDRQCGSGGYEIGKKLALKLGIPCYDKRTIEQIGRKKGCCEDVIKRFEGHYSKNELISIAMSSYGDWYSNDVFKPLQMSIRNAQVDIIKKLAEESCVIIGEAADQVLKGQSSVNVFIHADYNMRVKRMMQNRQCSEEEAIKNTSLTDRERAQFYRYYTNKRWGEAENYHLTIDSSRLGIEKSVELIQSYLILFESK